MIKAKGSGIFNDRNAMGKLPLHKKMGEYFPHQELTTPKPETKNRYTTDGLVAGGDSQVEEKGRIVTGKKGGKPVRFEIKGGSVFKGGKYVGTEKEVLASLDTDAQGRILR